MTQEQTKQCPYCGEDILAGAKKCKHCGEWLEETVQPITPTEVSRPEPPAPQVNITPGPAEQNVNQPVYVQTTVTQQTNGLGSAGFTLSLIAAILSWLPGVNLITWFLGALFSLLGLFKSPRGLAFAGLVISFIDVIIVVSLFGAAFGVLESLFS